MAIPDKKQAEGDRDTEINDRISRYWSDLKALLDMKPRPIKSVAAQQLKSATESDAKVSGVYLISRSSTGEIVYVGKNNTQTIAKRAHDHIHIDKSSDLKAMVKRYKDLSQNVSEYDMRWVQIDDETERHYFEAFAMAALRPRMNFKEPDKGKTEAEQQD